MMIGAPSTRRLSTEKAVSSSWEMLGMEPPLRRTGLRGVRNEDLENRGMLAARDIDNADGCALINDLWSYLVVAMVTFQLRDTLISK